MEYKFISWNKNSEVILKKKNLSLVTVTNDKFNFKILLTIFFDLEVRIDFISTADFVFDFDFDFDFVFDFDVPLMSHPWHRHLADVSPTGPSLK